MDSHASKTSTGLADPSIKVEAKLKDEVDYGKVEAKIKHEVDYDSTISGLEHIGISPKREVAPENTSIQAEGKIQVLQSIQMENYNMAKEVAGNFTKVATMSKKKITQTRKSWSDKETETLLKLIERHGTSWSKLKEKDVDDVLESRDQTSLRDKARNMKMDYVK